VMKRDVDGFPLELARTGFDNRAVRRDDQAFMRAAHALHGIHDLLLDFFLHFPLKHGRRNRSATLSCKHEVPLQFVTNSHVTCGLARRTIPSFASVAGPYTT